MKNIKRRNCLASKTIRNYRSKRGLNSFEILGRFL